MSNLYINILNDVFNDDNLNELLNDEYTNNTNSNTNNTNNSNTNSNTNNSNTNNTNSNTNNSNTNNTNSNRNNSNTNNTNSTNNNTNTSKEESGYKYSIKLNKNNNFVKKCLVRPLVIYLLNLNDIECVQSNGWKMLYYFLLEWKASLIYDDVIIASQKTFEEAVIIINKFREYNFECIIMHNKYTFFRSFLPKDFIRSNHIKNKSKKRNYMIMKNEENDKKINTTNILYWNDYPYSTKEIIDYLPFKIVNPILNKNSNMSSDIYIDNHLYCSLCLNDINNYEICTILPCGHVFHRNNNDSIIDNKTNNHECIGIVNWLNKKKNCPLCRFDISSKKNVYKYSWICLICRLPNNLNTINCFSCGFNKNTSNIMDNELKNIYDKIENLFFKSIHFHMNNNITEEIHLKLKNEIKDLVEYSKDFEKNNYYISKHIQLLFDKIHDSNILIPSFQNMISRNIFQEITTRLKKVREFNKKFLSIDPDIQYTMTFITENYSDFKMLCSLIHNCNDIEWKIVNHTIINSLELLQFYIKDALDKIRSGNNNLEEITEQLDKKSLFFIKRVYYLLNKKTIFI